MSPCALYESSASLGGPQTASKQVHTVAEESSQGVCQGQSHLASPGLDRWATDVAHP